MGRHITRRRLYLFPALIPLVELVPWLLGALGAVAGLAGLSFATIWERHRYKILSFTLACFLAAGGMVAAHIISSRPDAEIVDAGSRLIPQDQLPKTITYPVIVDMITSNKPADSFSEVRSQRVTTQILASPVMSGDRLVTATYKGTVEAYEPLTGKSAWSLALKEPIIALTEKDGVSYVGEGLHQTQVASLTAVRSSDGKVLWRREILGHIEEAAAVLPEQKLVLTGSGPGGLWALGLDDGRAVWHAKIGHMDSTPLFHDGVVYAQAMIEEGQDKGGYFYALDAQDGKVLWRLPLPGQPWGEPILSKDGKTVLTTTGNGQIGVARDTDGGWAHAISMADKKVLWTKNVGGMPLQPSAYVPEMDVIIHTLKNGEIVAMNPDTGDILWSKAVGKDIQAAATLTGTGESLLAVVTFDGIFRVLRASNGADFLRRDIPKGSTSSALVDGDTIYVATPYQITVFRGLQALAETK